MVSPQLTELLICSTDRSTHDKLTLAVASCIQKNPGSEVLLLILQTLHEIVEGMGEGASVCKVRLL